MSSLREPTVGLIATALLLASAVPAQAHHRDWHICNASTGVFGGGGHADASCEEQEPGGARPDPVAPTCDPTSSVIHRFGDPPPTLEVVYLLLMAEEPPPDGEHYQAAYNCADIYIGGPYLVPDPTWDDAVDARDEARASVTPALPEPNVSPAQAIVRTPTWLWIDETEWATSSATATQGGVTVTVTARPVSVVWDMDEGERRCDGPGTAWSEDAQAEYDQAPESTRDGGSPACTFTFVHSSTTRPRGVHEASVTVTWAFSWSLNGTPRGVFGTVDRTTDFDLTVGEVQALITDY